LSCEALLPVLLSALALLACTIFLVFGPVLVARPGATHGGDDNRDRDGRDEDERDTGRYGDAQTLHLLYAYKGRRVLPDGPMLLPKDGAST
jgi:hypothetical protein